jgi:hypothetical protein
MSDRNGKETRESAGTVAAVAAAGLIAAIFIVRWLSRLDDLQLAGMAAGTLAAVLVCWAVWPRRRLPRHRVRHMRLRARLRLHPGHGHATAAELWLRWGRLAAARRARRSRPSLSFAERLRPERTSVLIGRAHYGHALRVPVEEHAICVARRGRERPGRWQASSPITRGRWWPPALAATCTR